MSIFNKKAEQSNELLETANDQMGLFTQVIHEGGVYKAVVKNAYFNQKSPSEDYYLSLNLEMTHPETGAVFEYADKIYSVVTATGDITKKDAKGEEVLKQGYIKANSLSVLTLGKVLTDVATVPKIVKEYNFTLKQEINVEVQTIQELIGKELLVGLSKESSNKNVQDPLTNVWTPSKEKVTKNVLQQFFNLEGFSFTEVRDDVKEPVKIKQFEEKYTNKEISKYKEVTDSPVAEAAATATGSTTTRKWGAK